jgi:crotonobetainyl-CoA:carnitine CoA-transferase CaiB-like acyl-CoA transferase
MSGGVWPNSEDSDGRLLTGVKVLDLSRVLAGPYCAMVLADLGADVVKVEAPGGDETRRWGPPFFQGTASYYFGTNRNKRGVVLDLGKPGDRSLFQALAAEADVVIQNFTGTAAARLGADYESIRAINPTVIHLTVSGFGPEEPDRRGYDVIAQALSGMMAITGEADRPGAKVGVPISDLAAAMFGALAVVSALFSRERTGDGTRLDVSLYDATLALLANQSMNWLLSGEETPRIGSEHPNITPYGAHATRDGAIVLGVGSDAQFRDLCDALSEPALADDARFRTNIDRIANREDLRRELNSRLAERTSAEWMEALDARGVPNAVVRSVGNALASPETRSVTRVRHPEMGEIAQVMGPIRVDKEYQRPYLPPPELGEHSDEIRRRWSAMVDVTDVKDGEGGGDDR